MLCLNLQNLILIFLKYWYQNKKKQIENIIIMLYNYLIKVIYA